MFSLFLCFLAGIRTEQDFYVRLIDSMTKQVNTLALPAVCHLSCYFADIKPLHRSSALMHCSCTHRMMSVCACESQRVGVSTVWMWEMVAHTHAHAAWLQAFFSLPVLLSLWLEQRGSERVLRNRNGSLLLTVGRCNGTSGIWSTWWQASSDRIQFVLNVFVYVYINELEKTFCR